MDAKKVSRARVQQYSDDARQVGSECALQWSPPVNSRQHNANGVNQSAKPKLQWRRCGLPLRAGQRTTEQTPDRSEAAA